MAKLTVTTKTKAQIRKDFAQAFKNIHPISTTPVTQKDRLEPYREEIMRQRQRGLTWKQIAGGMAPQPINEHVSEKLLRVLFGADEANVIPPQNGAPKQRLVLDAVTSQPIASALAPQPAISAPPPPMTPEEHQKFDPLLQGLIPPIVKTKMKPGDARNYASRAVERFRPNEVERFQQILTAELEALDETNCARYNVPPEEIAPWKRRWKRA